MTDAIVIGAGTAGCVAAKMCAENGLDTVLLDRKQRGSIGDKVCGDGVPLSLKDRFDPFTRFPFEETTNVTACSDVYAGYGHDNPLRLDETIHMIDRKAFGQRLLEEAEAAGAKFVQERVTGWVPGGVPTSSGERRGLVIDCSGARSAFRSLFILDNDYPPQHRINSEEIGICYREIVRAKDLCPDEVIEMYFSDLHPQGYLWVFPKGGDLYNVGVGTLKGAIPNPKNAVRRFLKDKEHTVLHAGGGHVPLSTPMRSFVSDGVMFCGDAAYQTNSATGGGIAFSLAAGGIAGAVAAEASDAETSTEYLWAYNILYHETLGRMLWNIYPFARLLRGLREDDLRFMLDREILTAADATALREESQVTPGAVERIRKLARAMTRPALLGKLARYVSVAKDVRAAVESYPTVEELPAWSARVDAALAGLE